MAITRITAEVSYLTGYILSSTTLVFASCISRAALSIPLLPGAWSPCCAQDWGN